MKQRFILLFALVFGLWGGLARAEEAAKQPSPSVYNIADVAVDVTADSAARARDQAITEAQHMAFGQLLDRLGADSDIAAKLNDNDLATLVQNFEVRNEKASSVRYIGVFAVQFRPSAVRTYLTKHNAGFSDAQGEPVLVLPVTKNGDKAILWEEPTRWLKLWSDAAHDGGIIPIIVPSGSADDKNLVTPADAAAGKVEPIKSLIDQYKANGAVVAVLNGAMDNPSAGFTIDLQHFGKNFDDGSEVEHITLAGNADKNAVDNILTQGIKQVRLKIEKDSREEGKKSPEKVWNDEEPPVRLPVAVQCKSVAECADIQRRLAALPGVKRVDVVSVDRGTTDLEIGFTGKPEEIQTAAAQHNLRLSQDVLSGQWMLKSF